MKKRIALLSAIGLLAGTLAHGADLAVWNSNNSTPTNKAFAVSDKAAGLAVADLTRGKGLLYTGTGYAQHTFAARNYDQTSFASALSTGDYWETTLNPQGGFLSLDSLSYSFGGPQSGPKAWQWAYKIGTSDNWIPLGTPYVSTRTSTKYEPSTIDLSGIPLTDQAVSLRLVVWNGGTTSSAWGSFGRDVDVLTITGSLTSGDGAPVLRFTPAMGNVDVGETLEIEVAVLPSGSEVTSWSCSPTPAGTPTFADGVFRYTALKADALKRFTLTVTARNSQGNTTGSASFFVNPVAAPGTLTLSFDNERQTNALSTVNVEIPAGSGTNWTLQCCMIDPDGTDDRVYSGVGRALRFAYDREGSFTSKAPVLQCPPNVQTNGIQTNGIQKISFWYGIFPEDAAAESEHSVRPNIVTELSDDAKTWVEVDRVSTMGSETALQERVIEVAVESPVYMRIRVEGMSGTSRVNVDQVRITPTMTNLDEYLMWLRSYNITPFDESTGQGDLLTGQGDDYDGDGASNNRERQRKKNPFDPTSHP